jgi:hypothetical protein
MSLDPHENLRPKEDQPKILPRPRRGAPYLRHGLLGIGLAMMISSNNASDTTSNNISDLTFAEARRLSMDDNGFGRSNKDGSKKSKKDDNRYGKNNPYGISSIFKNNPAFEKRMREIDQSFMQQ